MDTSLISVNVSVHPHAMDATRSSAAQQPSSLTCVCCSVEEVLVFATTPPSDAALRIKDLFILRCFNICALAGRPRHILLVAGNDILGPAALCNASSRLNSTEVSVEWLAAMWGC